MIAARTPSGVRALPLPRPPRAGRTDSVRRGNSGPSRSGPIEYGDETVTDTSTPHYSVSDATATTESSLEGVEETKKTETVASEGDLFRQSEIAADYIEGLLDI